jgi:hypothetical protein
MWTIDFRRSTHSKRWKESSDNLSPLFLMRQTKLLSISKRMLCKKAIRSVSETSRSEWASPPL